MKGKKHPPRVNWAEISDETIMSGSVHAVAKMLGCSHPTIVDQRRKRRLPPRTKTTGWLMPVFGACVEIRALYCAAPEAKQDGRG